MKHNHFSKSPRWYHPGILFHRETWEAWLGIAAAAALAALVIATDSHAQGSWQYGGNPYSPHSLSNPYSYGANPYSPTGVNNPYSPNSPQNPYSPSSPSNPYGYGLQLGPGPVPQMFPQDHDDWAKRFQR